MLDYSFKDFFLKSQALHLDPDLYENLKLQIWLWCVDTFLRYPTNKQISKQKNGNKNFVGATYKSMQVNLQT